VTQPGEGLDTIRQILFGAELARLEQAMAEGREKVTSQLEDLSRRQQAHADRVTQLLDQVMAELTRRTDALTTETKAGLEELRSRMAEIERRKLNVAEFGASLAALGQKYASGADEAARG
jgi:uncharacterized protein YoxC